MGARFDRIAALGEEKLDRFYGGVKKQKVCEYEGCTKTFVASGQGSTRRFCDAHRDKRIRDLDRERHRQSAAQDSSTPTTEE